MDISFLLFLSEVSWSRDLVSSLLCDPRTTLWGSLSLSRFKTQFNNIGNNFKHTPCLMTLLERHLLARCLLRGADVPEWFFRFVEETIDLEEHLPGMDWNACCAGRWVAAPMLLVGERAHLRWLLVGRVKQPRPRPFPPWVEELMDSKARHAVMDAMTAVSPAGWDTVPPPGAFTCFPLVAAHENCRIAGVSLGLSTALACIFLDNGGEGIMDVAAAGTVQKDGAVGPVGRLPEKVAHAAKSGFRLMVVPAGNRLPADCPEMDVLPAATLAEAWLLASLHGPGRGNRLRLFEAMLNDPRTFVDNCAAVPTQWLWWAKKNGRTGSVMAQVCSAESLFGRFVHHMGDCLRNGRLSHGETLAQLPDSPPRDHGDCSPASRFKWILVNLALANHRGLVLESEQWAGRAGKMVKGASVTDLTAFAAFYNYGFVGLRHNQYRFTPELPGPLADLLSSLETMHRAQCRILPGSQNGALGALYGTIAQNFGFCGPSFLTQTRKYVLLSTEAFGDDPSVHEDRRRQQHCLAYALMDAGRFREAEETLLPYLDVMSRDELCDRLPGFQKWEHALLARFLVDFRPVEMCRRYAQWVEREGASMVGKTHPWQLWRHNMGRVMLFLGRREEAVFFFKESLELCLSGRFGATVRVMAFLPLSGLRKSDALKGLNLDALEKTLRSAAGSLNPVHFQDLLKEKDFLKALDRVWEKPADFFPFTYR